MGKKVDAIDVLSELKLIQPLAMADKSGFTNISDEIIVRKNFVSILQGLLDKKNKDLLQLHVSELKDIACEFCSYRDSFLYRYLGIFPHFKKIYMDLKKRYKSAFEKFRQQFCNNLSQIGRFYELDDENKKEYFRELDVIRNELGIQDSGKYSNDSKFVFSCKFYSDILEDYYSSVNNLLKKLKNEIVELSKFRNVLIEDWGRGLPVDVVSSLKTVVAFFDLSEVTYRSLDDLRAEAYNNLEAIKHKNKCLESKICVMTEDLVNIEKLRKGFFERDDKQALKKLCTYSKNNSDDGFEILALASEQKQYESEQTDLSYIIYNLETIREVCEIKALKNNFSTLSFNYDVDQETRSITENSADKQKLNKIHEESVSNYPCYPDTCGSSMKHIAGH